jgi:transcriptional regulator with XRE-family HTH domain
MTRKEDKNSPAKSGPEWVRNLRRLMDEQGMNPRSLSLRAGLNATAVRDMIEGRSRSPRYDTVQAMADALQTTPAILMSSEKTAAEIAAKGDAFGRDIELLTEVIARLQETAEEMGRDLSPRDLAAMSATLYRRLLESGDGTPKKMRAVLKPQIHDLLEYEALRHKRGK